jgi:glutamine synthetase adenylyltransferase
MGGCNRRHIDQRMDFLRTLKALWEALVALAHLLGRLLDLL